MTFHCYILSILISTSCFQGIKEIIPLIKLKNDINNLSEIVKLKSLTEKDSILLEQRKFHFFSNTEKEDEFHIYLTGETIYKGTITFQITNHKEKLILKEKFSAQLLIGYEFIGDQKSLKDKEDFIIQRVMEFFKEENFIYPAISSKDIFDEDYSDKKIWEDIKSDKTAIGFNYLIGEEDGRRIAFSKKKGKVVMYFNCC